MPPDTTDTTTGPGSHAKATDRHDPSLTGAATANGQAEESPPDPFDPARYRLGQDFTKQTNVEEMLLRVPVEKPSAEWWVRTHPDPAFQCEDVVLIVRKDSRETYLVDPEVRDAIESDPIAKRCRLRLAISRHGIAFLWPVFQPKFSGDTQNPWYQSAEDATQIAETEWVRVMADMRLGAYRVFRAKIELGDPQWPDLPLSRYLEVAFKDRVIDSTEHPLIQALWGRA